MSMLLTNLWVLVASPVLSTLKLPFVVEGWIRSGASV